MSRFADLEVEQEFRFDNNMTSFRRSTTSLGFGYELVRDFLKINTGYDLICRDEENHYEMRHRVSVALNAQRKYLRTDFKIRTRLQSTYRDENRGDYKFNPKYVWRNRMEVQYNFFKLPLRPYASGEVLCPVNSRHGLFADEYRLTLGCKYRLTRKNTLDISLRYDHEIQQVAPENILYLNLGWKYKID